MSVRKMRKCYGCSLMFFVLSAATIFLIPFSRKAGSFELSIGGYILGIFFWLGILLGILSFGMILSQLKKDPEYQKWVKGVPMGAIAFFKSKAGRIADICFGIFVLLLILLEWIMIVPDFLELILMFLILVSFYFHFLVNGRVYRYLFLQKN